MAAKQAFKIIYTSRLFSKYDQSFHNVYTIYTNRSTTKHRYNMCNEFGFESNLDLWFVSMNITSHLSIVMAIGFHIFLSIHQKTRKSSKTLTYFLNSILIIDIYPLVFERMKTLFMKYLISINRIQSIQNYSPQELKRFTFTILIRC